MSEQISMNRCFDCVYCCIYLHSLVDVCDIDDHEIADVYHDCCDDFVMAAAVVA